MAEMTPEEMQIAIIEINRGIKKGDSKIDLSDMEKSKSWDALERQVKEIKKQGGMIDYKYFD